MPSVLIAGTMSAPDVQDDALLVDALRETGVDARRAAWDDPGEPWDAGVVVVRSTWGYHRKLPQFLSWLEHLDESGVITLNSTGCIRDNIDKATQFAWLDGLGVPRVPGELMRNEVTSEELVGLAGGTFPGAQAYVVKPSVSASGHQTLLFDATAGPDDVVVHRAASLIREVALEGRAALLQPFVPEIADGELALVYLGGG